MSTSRLLDHTSLSDAEILSSLAQHVPVDSAFECNIWAFWDKGLSAIKPWCQRNICSWVRRHPAWTVRVLDMVPGSPNHYSKFIPNTPDWFPDAFLQDSLAGTHKAPHASDLIRLPLLHLHGGVWLDVGFMLFRNLNDLCWDKLSHKDTEVELAGFRMPVTEERNMMWNGFIAARKGSVLVKYWHNTFLKLWEGRDSTLGMWASPILQHLPRYEVPSPPGEKPAFKYEDFVDYLIHMYCLERVRNMNDPSMGWNGSEYFHRSVYLLDVVAEVYWAQALTEWDGGKQFELLSRAREGADGAEIAHDDAWNESEAFLSGILSTSSTMKLGHGIVTDQRDYLARIWDRTGNEDADRTRGTFAERLRWASNEFEQKRPLERVFLSIKEDAQLEGDLLTAVGEPHPEVYPDGRF